MNVHYRMRGGPISCLDLIPLDFVLWGYIKPMVYDNLVTTVDENDDSLSLRTLRYYKFIIFALQLMDVEVFWYEQRFLRGHHFF